MDSCTDPEQSYAYSSPLRQLSHFCEQCISLYSGHHSCSYFSNACPSRINGDFLISNTHVPGLEWWVQGHTMRTDMKVLDLGIYDVVLVYDWLKAHSPMVCDWVKKTLQFSEDGVEITLAGVHTSHKSVQELSAKQVVKWCVYIYIYIKGNEIWAMAVIHEVSALPVTTDAPAEVQSLLNDFAHIFLEAHTTATSLAV